VTSVVFARLLAKPGPVAVSAKPSAMFELILRRAMKIMRRCRAG
jgi:hypothetical protein